MFDISSQLKQEFRTNSKIRIVKIYISKAIELFYLTREIVSTQLDSIRHQSMVLTVDHFAVRITI